MRHCDIHNTVSPDPSLAPHRLDNELDNELDNSPPPECYGAYSEEDDSFHDPLSPYTYLERQVLNSSPYLMDIVMRVNSRYYFDPTKHEKKICLAAGVTLTPTIGQIINETTHIRNNWKPGVWVGRIHVHVRPRTPVQLVTHRTPSYNQKTSGSFLDVRDK